jgi:hypothetical protein
MVADVGDGGGQVEDGTAGAADLDEKKRPVEMTREKK